VTRIQPLIPMGGGSGTTLEIPEDWSFNKNAKAWHKESPLTQSGTLIVPITNVVDLSSLTVVRVYVSGVGYSTLPTSMPYVDLEYVDSAGVVQQITPADVEDTSTTTGQFNVYHPITVTLSPALAIDQGASAKDIYMTLEYFSGGSAGASAFELVRIECDFTVTRLTPG